MNIHFIKIHLALTILALCLGCESSEVAAQSAEEPEFKSKLFKQGIRRHHFEIMAHLANQLKSIRLVSFNRDHNHRSPKC